METRSEQKTTKLELLQFGFGGGGFNLINNGLVGMYFLFFMTDQAKIPAAIAGTYLLIGKFVQMFLYPVVGAFYDKTTTRWGRYRPYLLFVTPITAVLAVLLFSVVSGLSITQKTVYYGAIYVAFCITCNIGVGLAMQSLIPLMSTDRTIRNFAVMSKQVIGNLGIAAGSAMVLPMVGFFSGTAQPWQAVAMVYGAILVLCMYICAYGVRRFDVGQETVAKKKSATFKEQIQILRVNKPLLFLACAYFFLLMSATITGSISMYLYKYVIKQPSLMVQLPMLQLPFAIALGVAMPYIFKKISKRTCFITAGVLLCIYPAVLVVFKPFANQFLILGLGAFSIMLGGICAIIGWSILPDCIDYAEWKTGKRSDALVTSCMSLATSLGIATGPFLTGWLLSAIGYSGGVMMTQKMLDSILYIATILPICCTLIALIFMKLFPITDTFYNTMLAELKEIRQAKQAL
ncbi:MFS transporter [Sporomusa acidovorans]|uniref:Isoprimeverose transporter n=1 Tax=Sporomusa acidovorans (strain ATCC 49682 / DSM 3132 / Mol) TaxID=1123286 RepID=A0ABZ3J0X8_SPOA4|nr:glycoside-pentoside-hexuronide (GPH):cation symporter [Sporomusa acidovorans]OZC22759.1 putative symporter YjmB [Sporomusa acidovorans DSM 3132]SDE50157.1 sugar (Glycoside-Pentoside-Hexuronide) transporter [Sporomusa acidovorans]